LTRWLTGSTALIDRGWRLPISGLGCVAGAAALGRLHDYLLGWRLSTDCFRIVLTTELPAVVGC
jgi:predicted naringenin-chalcone synthase